MSVRSLFSTTAVALTLVLGFAGQVSAAEMKCKQIFNSLPQSEAVKRAVLPDAYKQWLLWEQTANLKKYEKPTTTVDVPMVRIQANEVNIITTPDAPKKLIQLFKKNDGTVLWASHPYNRSEKVPYVNSPAATTIPVYMTSSRSLALDGELRGYTIKMGTDRPHGPNGEYQPKKVETNDDVDSALIHTSHLNAIDSEFGADDKLVILGEVMTIAEKKSGIGIVVRDVRATDDGNYYLPALSIPYVGREIAQINRVQFEKFFEIHFAALLGEAKARLLLRSGLQMLTPNPQNMLIQLDRQLKPTGKMVFRDVSDCYLVDTVAKGLGYEKQIALDVAAEYPPNTQIKPYWSNSAWRMNEAGPALVPTDMLERWGIAHNRAYVEYIKKELGLEIKMDLTRPQGDILRDVYEALSSDIGQAKLAQYRKRMKTQEMKRKLLAKRNSQAIGA